MYKPRGVLKMNAAIARAYSGQEPEARYSPALPNGNPCLGNGEVIGCMGQAVGDVYAYTPGYLARQGVPPELRYSFTLDLCENCALLYGMKISRWSRATMRLLHCSYGNAVDFRDEARRQLAALILPVAVQRRGELESITKYVHELTVEVGQQFDSSTILGGIITYIDATGLKSYGRVVVFAYDGPVSGDKL